MNINDKVKIIRSPYSCVKNCTIATIVDVKFKEYGKRYTLYILDTKSCTGFYEHELEKINEDI